MRDLVSIELRRLRRAQAVADRRIATMKLKGKVKPGSVDMKTRTVLLLLGHSADGSPIYSPRVKWQGTGAGAFKMHAVPADNEQMELHSASGTIGSASMAHWGTYDADHPAPSDKPDEAMFQLGDEARVTLGKDFVKLQFAASDDKGFIKQKKGGDVVAHPGKDGVVYMGGDPDKGDQFQPVMLADGTPALKLQAKMG